MVKAFLLDNRRQPCWRGDDTINMQWHAQRKFSPFDALKSSLQCYLLAQLLLFRRLDSHAVLE